MAHQVAIDVKTAHHPAITPPPARYDGRYSAFISYSHHDSAFAGRLHRRLERYRLPRHLRPANGKVRPDGRLKSIFRDRDEFSAAADLTTSVRAAIAEADWLIVICSDEAAGSVWVAREVALFREIHGDSTILAALPEAAQDGSLRAVFRAAGLAAAREPLAADFRRTGDGWRLATLKLVAALADTRLDSLVQRDAQRRIRQISAIAAGALAGMVAMGALTFAAVSARHAAERQEANSEQLVEYLLDTLRTRLKEVGRQDVLDVLNKGAASYYHSQDLTQLPASALEQRARLLQAIGEDDQIKGNLADSAIQFAEAARTTGALLKEDPEDIKRIYAHAQSEFWVGQLAWWLGDYAGVEPHFRAYMSLAQRLVAKAPNDPVMMMEPGYAQSSLGAYTLRYRMNYGLAEKYLARAIAAFQAAEALRPGDADMLSQRAEAYGWLGDSKRLEGRCDEASEARKKQHDILETLRAHDPRDAVTQAALLANQIAVARIDLCRKVVQSAIDAFRKGRAHALELSGNDPSNTELKTQIRGFELFLAWSLMKVSPRSRSQDDEISALIGDCDEKADHTATKELTIFCLLTSARKSSLAGDRERAQQSLDLAKSLIDHQEAGLSARWGLNFRKMESLDSDELN